MNNISKFFLFIAAMFFFLPAGFAFASSFAPDEIPSPIILETAEIKQESGSQIMVNGLVKPFNLVLIYLNGKYIGLANISEGNNNFSLFSYLSPIINSAENMTITAMAQDKQSRLLSSPAETNVYAIIEKNFFIPRKPAEKIKQNTATIIPAPLLVSPKQKTCEEKPVIAGFTKNQSIIKIFINNIFYGKVLTKNSSSSDAFFEYTPSIKLERGQYQAYAVAEDKNGNISQKSNIINFCVLCPQIIASSTAQILDKKASIIKPEAMEKASLTTAYQKASQKNKTNSKINIILFVAFLLMVIVWMVLVNKELINENVENKGKNGRDV
jgi:hypothetical protein